MFRRFLSLFVLVIFFALPAFTAEIKSGIGNPNGIVDCQASGDLYQDQNTSTVWLCTESNGKTWASAGFQTVRTTAQTTDSTSAAVTNIAGLAFPVAAGASYNFQCYVINTSAATTTGVRLSVTGPTIGAGLITFNTMTVQTAIATLSESASAYDAVSTSIAAIITVPQINRIVGFFKAGATAGNLQITMNTEIDGSAVTAEIGSWCDYSRKP